MAVVAVAVVVASAVVAVAVSAAVASVAVEDAGSDTCLYSHIEKLRRFFLRKSAKFFISASCQ